MNSEIYKPRFISNYLFEQKARPQKKWGQNFLIDENISVLIAESIRNRMGNVSILAEIGPGFGSLTKHLLALSQKKIVFELDPILVDFLKQECQSSNIEIIPGDFLVTKNVLLGYDKVYFCGNIPYSITSDIFTSLVLEISSFRGGVFMVQKEFAKRLATEISSISVLVSLLCKAVILRDVSKTCFYPTPDIDSSILSLESHEGRHIFTQEEMKIIQIFLRTFFWGKRKKISTSLKESPFLEKLSDPDLQKRTIEVSFDKLGISLNNRPEEISLNEYYSLFHEFVKNR